MNCEYKQQKALKNTQKKHVKNGAPISSHSLFFAGFCAELFRWRPGLVAPAETVPSMAVMLTQKVRLFGRRMGRQWMAS